MRMSLRWVLALFLPLTVAATAAAPAPLVQADPQTIRKAFAQAGGLAVLVNVWATWCGPCREEMPSIEALRVALEGKPFVVLAVNVGESSRAARAFADKLSLGFPLLLDRDTRAARAWKARVLPASFVIDAQGAIRYSYYGDLDWAAPEVREKIEALLPAAPMRHAGG